MFFFNTFTFYYELLVCVCDRDKNISIGKVKDKTISKNCIVFIISKQIILNRNRPHSVGFSRV